MKNHTAWRRWMAVGIVVIIVSIIALGHNGGSSVSGIRLIPFEEYVQVASCLIEACDGTGAWLIFVVIDGLGNLVIFMPLGATLDYALRDTILLDRKRLRVITLAGALLSLSYETVQLWLPGRVSAIDDVIINTAGTVLGAVFAQGLHSYQQKQQRRAIRRQFIG